MLQPFARKQHVELGVENPSVGRVEIYVQPQPVGHFHKGNEPRQGIALIGETFRREAILIEQAPDERMETGVGAVQGVVHEVHVAEDRADRQHGTIVDPTAVAHAAVAVGLASVVLGPDPEEVMLYRAVILGRKHVGVEDVVVGLGTSCQVATFGHGIHRAALSTAHVRVASGETAKDLGCPPRVSSILRERIGLPQ